MFTMFNFMFNFSMLDRFLRLGRLMLLKASTDIFVSLSLSFLETSGGVTSSVSLSLSNPKRWGFHIWHVYSIEKAFPMVP